MPDKLSFWNMTLNKPPTKLDFNGKSAGLPRRSSGDLTLIVKNQSGLYTASDVTVTIEDTTVAGARTQFLLSLDGISFTASLDLGDMPPNSVSTTFWLRRTTAST